MFLIIFCREVPTGMEKQQRHLEKDDFVHLFSSSQDIFHQQSTEMMPKLHLLHGGKTIDVLHLG